MKHDYLIGIMMKHDYLNYWSIIDETLLMKHDYLIGIMMKHDYLNLLINYWWKHYWWNMITS